MMSSQGSSNSISSNNNSERGGGDDDQCDGVVIDAQAKRKGEETWSGLDLSSQGLYNVSENIGYYTHLTSLFLTNNNLVALPKALFSNLINLTHIDVSYNRLTHIPPEIEELQRLKRLILYQNRITELPLEMGRLWRYVNTHVH
jgi:CCR4-NOT transcription complex subunit 6